MKKVHSAFVPFAVAFLALAALVNAVPAPLTPAAASALCVTEGNIVPASANRFSVNVSKMRAVLNENSVPEIEARFTYEGGTADESALGSGEVRRQFGLKLRAQDPCNLVYAMWRIEPKSQLVVSVKMNPGQHTSAECGNRGYTNIKAQHSAPLPALAPGSSHALHAEMTGDHLHVWADKALVWEGSVGAAATRFEGPVGIRSDNAKLEIELLVPSSSRGSRTATPCRAEPESE
jgi:hypothetical protein